MKARKVAIALLSFLLIISSAEAVHKNAQNNKPECIFTYGKLQWDNRLGDWHDAGYWTIAPPTDGRDGIENFQEWIEKNTPIAPLALPFDDRKVYVYKGFVHPPSFIGEPTHHAIDFVRPDGETFPVLAAADGLVIWVGYHPVVGNAVIIEHTPNKNGHFRTIYHNLRNGRDHDLSRALRTKEFIEANPEYKWEKKEKEWQNQAEKADRILQSGKGDLAWVERLFGTKEQTLLVSEGDYVKQGQQIGWAGNAGILTTINHLHFMIAKPAKYLHQNSSKDTWRWVLFDPYGIYGGQEEIAQYQKDDGKRGPLQHPSHFAPLHEDFIYSDTKTLSRALEHYAYFDYYPITLCAQKKGVSWLYSGSFQQAAIKPKIGILRTAEELQKDLDECKKQGFRLESISGISNPSGVCRCINFFIPDDKLPYSVETKILAEEFIDKEKQLKKAKYLLISLAVFTEAGKVYFTGNWVKYPKEKKYAFELNLTQKQLVKKDLEYQEKSLQLVQATQYLAANEEKRFAALWHPKKPLEETTYFLKLKEENFLPNRDAMYSEGYRIKFLENSKDTFSVIYTKKIGHLDSNPIMEKSIKKTTWENLLAENDTIRGLHKLCDRLKALPPTKRSRSDQDKLGIVKVKPTPICDSFGHGYLFEGESVLPNLMLLGGKVAIHNMIAFEGRWTGDSHLFWYETGPGSKLFFKLNAPAKGRYLLSTTLTKGASYGILQFFFDGKAIGYPYNSYHPETIQSERIPIGFVDLEEGNNRFTILITGKDLQSCGYHGGIDSFELIPENKVKL